MKKNIRLEDLNANAFKNSDNLDAVAHLGVAAALDDIGGSIEELRLKIFQFQSELEEIKNLLKAVGPAVSAYGEAANNKLDALLAAAADNKKEQETEEEQPQQHKETNRERAKRIAAEVKEAIRKKRLQKLQKQLDKLQEGGVK